jgi:hypothetical protein
MELYNINDVTACLKGVVGFRDDFEPCAPDLPAELQDSSSGLFINEGHPLATLDNLRACAPVFELKPYPIWDIATAYAIGDIIIYDNIYYVALTANTGNQPDVNTADWRVKLFFGEWLETKVNAYIGTFVNRVFSEKIGAKVQKNVLADRQIFGGMGRPTQKIVKDGRFVGFSFNDKGNKNLSFRINRIGIQADTAQTLTMYLYHSSQDAPLQTFAFTFTNALSFQWLNLAAPIDMYYSNSVYDSGTFYLGYYEDDLNGQVIEKRHNYEKGCTSCASRTDYILQDSYNDYVELYPIRVDNSDLNGTNLFNTDNIKRVNMTNNGINLNISVSCDLTDLLCRHSQSFAYPLQKWIAFELVRYMANSTELNRKKTDAAKLARFSLESEEMQKQQEMLIKQSTIDFSDLGAPCMPCEARNGIRVKTA